MDDVLSTLGGIAKQLALLTETLERRSTESVQEQRLSGASLKQAVIDLRNDVNRLIESSGDRIGQLAKGSVDAALAGSTAKYTQAVTVASATLDGSSRHVEQVQHENAKHTWRHIWMAYAAVIGANLLALGGLWFQTQSYNDARARTAAAQIDAETAEAYSQVGVTSCGGRPCVKLDKKAPHWGSNGDYVLLDPGYKPKPSGGQH
jgi:hypothetical protein